MTPETLRARILHQDDDVIVIDKPAGLAVHQAGRIVDHLDLYLPWLAADGGRVPGLAHRLDRDTAGCLALGRTDLALSRLGVLFAQGRVEKTYWAACHGDPPAESEGEIDLPLLKLRKPGGFAIVADPTGKPARSAYKALGSGGGFTWLELTPHTGRTHQLRVHCAAIGLPIVGDPFYGPVKSESGRGEMHLLSRRIAFQLRREQEKVTVTAPVPPHMRAALSLCGWDAPAASDDVQPALPALPALQTYPPSDRPR